MDVENSWVIAFSKTYKRAYWCNKLTKASTWVDPTIIKPVTSGNKKRKVDSEEEIETKCQRITARVAIIVPFQDAKKEQNRRAQLEKFLPHIGKFLSQSKADFKVFIIEQFIDDRKFNRGKLLNIGFDIACKEGYNTFIYHDVDLLPSSELLEFYTTIPATPVHIARVWDRYSRNEKYFGGIVAFSESDFRKINGFPNNFWGWGGEDDALIRRVSKLGLQVDFPKHGSIVDLEGMSLTDKLDFLREHKEWKCSDKWECLNAEETNWQNNGLKNLSFKTEMVERLTPFAEKYTVNLD